MLLFSAAFVGCFGGAESLAEPSQQTASLPAPAIENAPKHQPKSLSPTPTPKPIPAAHRVRAPHVPTPLEVPGFRPASHVGPADSVEKPHPIVVVLHGNYDRPEWQCEMWRQVADFYGWVLCPRGIPTPWADPSEDRWMYRGSPVVSREIEVAISSLKSRYPGQVSDNGDRILVGFSLGGLLAPNIIVNAPNRYAYLYLVEGGAAKLDPARIKALRRAGILGIGLAASTGSNRRASREAAKRLHRRSLPSVYVDMSGAGHNYRDDFASTGRQSLRDLLSKVDSQNESLQNGALQNANDRPAD